MKILITILLLICPIKVFAYDIQNPIVDQGVSDAKKIIDQDNQTITNLTNQNQALNDEIIQTTNTNNATIQSNQTAIANLQSDALMRKQGLTVIASQPLPVQSAIDLLNFDPSYGINWTGLISDTTKVNWSQVALLHLQGTNWQSIQSIMGNINWQAINQENGINWVTLNTSNINWENWSNASANGENWAQFINNGGN